MTEKIRVLIADDHSVVRMGLASLLGTSKSIDVVGEAVDGVEAVQMAQKLKPDVVVMDLVMPRKDGVTATEEIHATIPNIKIIILTTFGTSDDIARALGVGASGAIMKSATNQELLEAIQSVAVGKRVISAEVEGILKNDPPIPALSQRQRDILESITRGLTNKEIAIQFNISLESVKSHIKVILEKLGASCRTEAASIAQRKNLLR